MIVRLLGLALGGDGGGGGGDGFLVAQVVVLDGLEVVVEFVDEGDAGGNVEADDLFVGDVVEVLDEGAEAIAVGGDDDALAVLEGGDDRFVPVGEEAGDRVLEAFGEGEFFEGEVGVARVVAGVAGVVEGSRTGGGMS